MMKKPIRDARGNPLKLENLIGYGTFGKVYRAVSDDGQVYAAKFPYTADDLTEGDRNITDTKILCARLIREEGHQLKGMPPNLRPEVQGIIDGGKGTPCLLMEYLSGSVAALVSDDLHFADLLDILAAICRGLSNLHQMGLVHGNLKPGNIFIENAESVRFTDPAPENGRLFAETVGKLPGWSARLPPEVLGNIEGQSPLNMPSVDTFAIGKLFYQAVVDPKGLRDAQSMAGLFIGPIDKSQMEPFNAALEARHLEDAGNPHTKELFFRRCSALINRALSADTAPSPPFRFYRAADLALRFEELRTLFHPTFEQMGPIVLDRPTGNQSFVAGEDIRFSLSFKVQGGLTNPDLLNCFIYVRDLNKEQKVKNLEQEVLPVHDGNRFRCEFRLGGLEAGEYLLRVGMGLKGTPGKPIPRDIFLEVDSRPVLNDAPTAPANSGAPQRPEPLNAPLNTPPGSSKVKAPTVAPAPAARSSQPRPPSAAPQTKAQPKSAAAAPSGRSATTSKMPPAPGTAAPAVKKRPGAASQWPRDAKAPSGQWPKAAAPQEKPSASGRLQAMTHTQWPEPVAHADAKTVPAQPKAAPPSLDDEVETPPDSEMDTEVAEVRSDAQDYYDRARKSKAIDGPSGQGLLSNRDMLLIAGAVFLVVLGAILWLT